MQQQGQEIPGLDPIHGVTHIVKLSKRNFRGGAWAEAEADAATEKHRAFDRRKKREEKGVAREGREIKQECESSSIGRAVTASREEKVKDTERVKEEEEWPNSSVGDFTLSNGSRPDALRVWGQVWTGGTDSAVGEWGWPQPPGTSKAPPELRTCMGSYRLSQKISALNCWGIGKKQEDRMNLRFAE